MRKCKIQKFLFVLLICCLFTVLAGCFTAPVSSCVSYTITFNPNNGEQGFTQIVAENEKVELPNAPEKEGYQFDGWYENERKWSFIDDVPTEDITLTAQWIANKNKLVFIGNGATQGDMSTLSLAKNETITLPVNSFSKDYYHFVGWSTKPNGEIVYADGAEYTMDELKECALYAIWEYGTNGLVYKNVLGTYKITDYLGEEAKVGIPAFYNGQPVISISEDAFRGKFHITAVEIPNTVTSIQRSAFGSCSKLKDVRIANGLEIIEDFAFSYCRSLENINLPDTVVCIGERAFFECIRLTNIAIPDTTTLIGGSAFDSCESLVNITVGENNQNYQSIDGNLYTKIGKLIQYALGKTDFTFVIPDGTISVETFAFDGCKNLTNLIIPESVELMYPAHCENLSNITVAENNPYYQSIDGNLYTKSGELVQYAQGKKDSTFIIPKEINTICNAAFFDCKNLASIVIPNHVTTIDYAAFGGCDHLTNIYYEGTVEEWSNMNIDLGNEDLERATKYYYSGIAPALNFEETAYDGNYWHYGDNSEIVVWIY